MTMNMVNHQVSPEEVLSDKREAYDRAIVIFKWAEKILSQVQLVYRLTQCIHIFVSKIESSTGLELTGSIISCMRFLNLSGSLDPIVHTMIWLPLLMQTPCL